ncbi:hypothetical protein [Lentzea sp. NPDC004782]|uniref:hypothetical protein n=1 Tax=Lentzea sp. NPDC004782 TaxID=3154458 RepID=UPI0033B4B614
MKRLAFIRLLHQQGIDQSRLPEPLTFTSILSFHDAVELFLILTGEHLQATLSDRIQFMQYWTELGPRRLANGVDLSGRVAMDRLNRLRNAFKHAGAMPGAAAIEQARADLANFFEDNTPKVFGVAYDRVDMTEIVPQNQTRDKIKKAVATNFGGDRIEAMALLVEAFDELFAEVDRHSYPSSPFSFGRRIHHPLREYDIHSILRQPSDQDSRMPIRGAEKLAEEFDIVRDIALSAQDALRVMVLGIDYREYERFRQLTPSVYGTFGVSKLHRSHSDDYAPDQSEFDFCQQFVITVALRYAEHQAYLDPPSWKQVAQP